MLLEVENTSIKKEGVLLKNTKKIKKGAKYPNAELPFVTRIKVD